MKLNQTVFEDAVYGAEKEMAFTIDDSNPIIFDILRDKMYSDKIGSICREVISNCRDANREAGNGHLPVQFEIIDPNEVLFVSDLSISFNDKGLGITPDRMADVFVKYAASTKRDTNSQTGGFGLGAKTPFAYTDTFTVITVCNYQGQTIEYVYSAMIDSTRKGKMILFSSEPVNKPTGTRIILPIKSADRNEFETKAIKATFLWGEGIEYINFDKQVSALETIIDEEQFSIHKDKNHVLSTLSDGYVLAIDGVPYPINKGLVGISDNALGSDYIIEIKVEVGQLNISANREAIQYDDDVIKYINEVRQQIKDILGDYISGYVMKAPSFLEACFRRLALTNDKTVFKIQEGDIMSKLIKDASQHHYTIVNDSFTELGNRKGMRYSGIEMINKISLKYHNVEYVSFNYNEKWEYSSFPDQIKEIYLRPVYIRDAKKDGRRNATIIQQPETEGKAFLMLIADYDLKNPTVDQSEELHKLINVYGLDIRAYSDVEKSEIQALVGKRYVKKDIVDINAVEFNQTASSYADYDMRTLKYDRENNSVQNLTIDDIVVELETLQSTKIKYSLGTDLVHMISIIKFMNPKTRIYGVNKLSYNRYFSKAKISDIKKMYDEIMISKKTQLEELCMLSSIADKLRDHFQGIPKMIAFNTPHIMSKSLNTLFEKYPDLKTGKVEKLKIYWAGKEPKSTFNLQGAINSSLEKIKRDYPMIPAFVDQYTHTSTASIKQLKDYVKIMDLMLSKR